MTINIPGKPIAKKRPRFARRGNFVHTYSDQETEEGRFLWELKQQWETAPIPGPVVLEMVFFLPIAKHISKRTRAEMEENRVRPLTKPDLDNLEKFAMDCMNGVVYFDDKQVVKKTSEKRFSERGKYPCTLINVTPLVE